MAMLKFGTSPVIEASTDVNGVPTNIQAMMDDLVDAVIEAKDNGLSEEQAYNLIHARFSSTCSDYLIQSSIRKAYK